MKYIVKSHEMEELINHLDKIINEDITVQVKNMNECVNKLVWKGDAYLATMRVYNNMMKEINLIPEYLNLYLDFMKLAIGDYGEGIEEIKARFMKLREENYKLGERDEL